MKKIIFIALFTLGFAGSGQAALIDGESAGVNKHLITGLGNGDIFQADSNATATVVSFTDVGTAVTANVIGNTDGVVNGFIHDFLFAAVETTFFSVSSVSETSPGDPGTFIDPLVMEIWKVNPGPGNDVMIGGGTLTQVPGFNTRAAAAMVLLEAGMNYVVRMSNEGGTVGSSADYSLEFVSAVPVPAAVWLFGTALLGFFGYGRKKAQAAA